MKLVVEFVEGTSQEDIVDALNSIVETIERNEVDEISYGGSIGNSDNEIFCTWEFDFDE